LFSPDVKIMLGFQSFLYGGSIPIITQRRPSKISTIT